MISSASRPCLCGPRFGQSLALAAVAALMAALPALAQQATPNACESLAKLALPHTTIDLAETVAAGQFKVPGQAPAAQAPAPPAPGAPAPAGPPQGPPPVDTSKMPAFCRIAASVHPAPDSDIKIEVWLPLSGWNGKFYAAGNGSWAGSIPYRAMVDGVVGNYATAGTDTGHQVLDGSFIPGHPEKFIDYGYRADHEMTLRAKELVKAFYKADPKYSYWIGCSLGGMEALVEADRYPEDYDAIISGAPMNPMSMFNAYQMYPGWLAQKYPDAVIPPEKFAVMHESVMKACAGPVGIKQGFVEDPGSCKWTPDVLLCKGADAPDCLTAAQLDTAHKLYRGAVNPRTGELIFPGMAPGIEGDMVKRGMVGESKIATNLYRFAAYQDPNWDWTTMDYDTAIDKARKVVDPVMRAGNNLTPFLKRGGKLLLHGGWAELRNGNELAQYYQDVLTNAGHKNDDQVRLFLIPGMGHCGGGNGPNQFDKLASLDQWVTTGKAPSELVMSKVEQGKVVRTRPTCAWPAVAKYNGAGSMDEASSFTCAKP